jgi:hypothetical protein
MKRAMTGGKRLNHEPPVVTAKLGWRYHHIGIPHTQPRARERHVAHLGFTSPASRPVPSGSSGSGLSREILIAPTQPSVGVRVAFILDDGAPVELLEFYTAKPVRPKTGHAADRRATPDDDARAEEGRRRRSAKREPDEKARNTSEQIAARTRYRQIGRSCACDSVAHDS